MPLRSDKEWHRLRAELPKTAREYLDANKRHDNGSWATLVSLATYCLTARFMYDEFRYVVLESDFAGTTSLLATGKREKQCQDAWEHAEDNWTPPEDRDGIRAMVSAVGGRVAEHHWKGRSGTSDRLVATAIVDVCHERGTYSPVLSARFLAERTSLSPATVARSLKRLTRIGFVRYLGLTEQWNSHYRLSLRWKPQTKTQTETSSLLRSTCLSLQLRPSDDESPMVDRADYQSPVPLHDAFVSGALGQTAGRIWFTMDGPMTVAEAATEYGVSRDTARRNLDKLTSVGLASKGEGRPAVYKVNEVSADRLDEIAAEFGTSGWLERQRESHEAHREAHELGRQLRMEATRNGYNRRET